MYPPSSVAMFESVTLLCMTLALDWVRKVGSTSELVMAADSRLRFGCAWDCCPKVIAMPRSDMAMCFSGDTFHAYPLMLQVSSAIGSFSPARSRAKDIYEVRGRVIEVFNQMRTYIGDLPRNQTEPEIPNASFIVGGYSWRYKRFAIWLVHFDAILKKFTFRPASAWRGGNSEKKLVVSGDYTAEFKSRLVALLRSRTKLKSGGFDMEPFEVLRDMLRSEDYPLIGGSPQLLKIQEHMNTTPYSIYWPNKASGKRTYMGRPLLDYETSDSMAIDPDTFELYGRDSSSLVLIS